jgi:hypothetical protein
MVRERNGEEKEGKERKGYQGHIEALFFAYLVPFKRSQRDDSNHILENHQTML